MRTVGSDFPKITWLEPRPASEVFLQCPSLLVIMICASADTRDTSTQMLKALFHIHQWCPQEVDTAWSPLCRSGDGEDPVWEAFPG